MSDALVAAQLDGVRLRDVAEFKTRHEGGFLCGRTARSGDFAFSPSFLTGLTRSSRLTPIHMASAAATNTDE